MWNFFDLHITLILPPKGSENTQELCSFRGEIHQVGASLLNSYNLEVSFRRRGLPLTAHQGGINNFLG